MDPGTQSGGCQSGSRQPRGRRDGVHRVQYLSFKRALKKIISTKNANLTFADEGFWVANRWEDPAPRTSVRRGRAVINHRVLSQVAFSHL